ncbi:MAG: SPOR domain-containing protein [Bernardetiaceae bacterium]
MNLRTKVGCLICLSYLLYAFTLLGQEKDVTAFSLKDLNQQPIEIKHRLQVKDFAEMGDTSLITYDSKMVEQIQVYSIYIEGSHPILNPNPTGLIINGKKYNFYCSPERSQVKYLSAFMDIYEFSYLNRNYICFFAFREDCINKCRYRCYNVYDVTDPNDIQSYSFASIYDGTESFGDFNHDGKMDFVVMAPKSPESYLVSEKDDDFRANVLVTAYTLRESYAEEIFKADNGTPYYIYIKPQADDLSSFTVLQTDWFVPLKSASGQPLPPKSYYPEYVSFDPMNDFIYDSRGYRVDKKNWVLHLSEFPDMEGAQDFCNELKEAGFREAYILVDQYNDITFHVLYGNYWGRERAEEMRRKLYEQTRLEGTLKNIRKDF